ncbi:MAG TPA: lysophospholipid acyltransferase family protein [Thermoanaerobaculia bacterium]|nr:lysophospholipid acyltransferase family protein [Thermoanaerobaculia bacterium]
MSWFRRFLVHGVFWRQLLRFGVLNAPLWTEPIVMAIWSTLFLLWGAGRRGVMSNLTAILPGSTPLANLFRAWRVLWNFAWTIADNVRYKETRVTPDWDFVGIEHFEQLESHHGGAIILTAHMGSYDLGAHLFAEISKRQIVMVRAPETDPETRQFEEELHERTAADTLQVDFNTRASELALDLLGAVQRGELVAIQGDRVTPGISTLPATLFGKPTLLPAGPFALAMAARVPIYPLFIIRMGRRRYRLVVGKPFEVVRARDRAEAFQRAVDEWTRELESVIRKMWFQWFNFEPFSQELGR